MVREKVMQINLDFRTVLELMAITASLFLGIIVLVNHWRERTGRLFGLLCMSLSIWKAFDFAYPRLSASSWVDAVGWATGIFCVALAIHFVVAYSFEDRREPRLLYASGYPFAAIFILASCLGLMGDSTPWQIAYGVFYLTGVGVVVGLLAEAYAKVRRNELLWALAGSAALAIGAGLHLLAIIMGNNEFPSQTYGMLAFEICLGYDILKGGFLRERERHMRALEELGLRERRLEEAEAAFQRLVDTSYDIIFTIDREGRVTAIKSEVDEGLLGYKVDQLMGFGYLDFLSDADKAKLADALVRGFRGEKIRSLEVHLKRQDMPPAVLSLTATRLGGDGEEAALLVARDISEERRMEVELQNRNVLLEEANVRLRELNTLKTELVGIIGHELRSPLTIIFSYAAALKDHWNKMEDSRKLECVDHMMHECNRLNRMVENVLDMSRVESERLFLHRQRGDLFAHLEGVIREMSVTTDSHPTRLITSAPHLEMEADWDKIKQVVINLLDNAYHFSFPGGEVIVTGEARDGKAVVRVKDRGPGIPLESRERLFERFTQSKVSGMERGLGLGLYIVRTFVEAHGGEVWLEDEEDFGAIVAFSLPLKAD
jgi:PAS domain S-box-containing protein